MLAEDASRFTRQLIIQEVGFIALIERGVRVGGQDIALTE
jgi:hypothetical protein